jgi:hypothetical protein
VYRARTAAEQAHGVRRSAFGAGPNLDGIHETRDLWRPFHWSHSSHSSHRSHPLTNRTCDSRNAERRNANRFNRRVRLSNRFARPLSNAPVPNRWFRQSRRLSLVAMRPQQAHVVSGVGPAHELPQQKRTGRPNWIHILLAAAGITFASAVAGVLFYHWYFDSVLVGLSSSLQPLSDAFHQLGASHLTHASPAPGN